MELLRESTESCSKASSSTSLALYTAHLKACSSTAPAPPIDLTAPTIFYDLSNDDGTTTLALSNDGGGTIGAVSSSTIGALSSGTIGGVSSGAIDTVPSGAIDTVLSGAIDAVPSDGGGGTIDVGSNDDGTLDIVINPEPNDIDHAASNDDSDSDDDTIDLTVSNCDGDVAITDLSDEESDGDLLTFNPFARI